MHCSLDPREPATNLYSYFLRPALPLKPQKIASKFSHIFDHQKITNDPLMASHQDIGGFQWHGSAYLTFIYLVNKTRRTFCPRKDGEWHPAGHQNAGERWSKIKMFVDLIWVCWGIHFRFSSDNLCGSFEN